MADQFIIRRATESDAENIYNIHVAAIRSKCSTHYSAKDVEIWVARQDKARYLPFIQANEILVAEGEEGKILGFGHLTRDAKETDGKTMQIRGLFVDPDCGVKGVGSTLLKELEKKEKQLSEVDTMVVHSSLSAVEFYKKYGFISKGITSTHQMCEPSSLQCHKMIKEFWKLMSSWIQPLSHMGMGYVEVGKITQVTQVLLIFVFFEYY